MNVFIPVSPGELIDKITILEIKKRRVKDKGKLKNIIFELTELRKILNGIYRENKRASANIKKLKNNLLTINKKLWDIENEIRLKESGNKFDTEFIDLARSVYITNDKRSEVKNKINTTLGSLVKEVKEYTKY